MFENIIEFFKKITKQEKKQTNKDTAKERLHLVLMQDRANVSADFLDLMKQEIIEVIKKYIDVDENSIDVRLTNKTNSDGTTGAPALYANIPIVSIKEEAKKIDNKKQEEKQEIEDIKEAKKIIKQEEAKIAKENEDKKSEAKEAVEAKKQEELEIKKEEEKVETENKEELKEIKEEPKKEDALEEDSKEKEIKNSESDKNEMKA